MVETLMLFTRAEREDLWNLHLTTFQKMFPFMLWYDNTNYGRWSLIYLIYVFRLDKSTPEVYTEFLDGNFVIKFSNGFFNQILTDQAIEFLDRMCKVMGGVIGITQTLAVLYRWTETVK